MKKALAIFTTYYHRLECAVGKFIGLVTGEHRTSNAERRTSNGENAGPSALVDTAKAAIEDNSFLALQFSGENGSDRNQHPTTNIEHPTSNQEGAVPNEHTVSATHATHPEFENAPRPGTATVPVASGATGERDARGSRQANARGESPPFSASLSSAALAKEDPRLITRDELKRELDSLRRILESKGK